MSTQPVAVITGANKGLGYFAAEGLAANKWRVILVGRNPERLDTALTTLHSRVPQANISTIVADLARLSSARRGAERLRSDVDHIDVLINNAGIVHAPPTRNVSPDGLELVMATNLIGHVAWTDALFDRLTPQARIVWLGSLASRISGSPLTDFYSESAYKPWRVYAQSKLAVQVFGIELARRLKAQGLEQASIIADPGYSIGGLTERVNGINNPNFRRGLREYLKAPFAQGKHTGAAHLVHAASAPGLPNGSSWGPRWLTKGRPTQRGVTKTSRDPDIGLRVWDQSVDDAEASTLARMLPAR